MQLRQEKIKTATKRRHGNYASSFCRWVGGRRRDTTQRELSQSVLHGKTEKIKVNRFRKLKKGEAKVQVRGPHATRGFMYLPSKNTRNRDALLSSFVFGDRRLRRLCRLLQKKLECKPSNFAKTTTVRKERFRMLKCKCFRPRRHGNLEKAAPHQFETGNTSPTVELLCTTANGSVETDEEGTVFTKDSDMNGVAERVVRRVKEEPTSRTKVERSSGMDFTSFGIAERSWTKSQSSLARPVDNHV